MAAALVQQAWFLLTCGCCDPSSNVEDQDHLIRICLELWSLLKGTLTETYRQTDWLMESTSAPAATANPSLSSSWQGDHTWATMLGQSVRLQPVPIQSLSELERARLQEVALYHLDERDLGFKISIPRGTK